MSQLHAARIVALNGSASVLAGLLFGTVIGSLPFPDLALGAHVQFMQNGVIAIVLALVMASPLCQLSSSSVRFLQYSVYLIHAPNIAEAIGSEYGLGMPLIAKRSGIAAWAGNKNVELFFKLAHFGPGMVFLASWALVTYGVWSANTGGSRRKLK